MQSPLRLWAAQRGGLWLPGAHLILVGTPCFSQTALRQRMRKWTRTSKTPSHTGACSAGCCAEGGVLCWLPVLCVAAPHGALSWRAARSNKQRLFGWPCQQSPHTSCAPAAGIAYAHASAAHKHACAGTVRSTSCGSTCLRTQQRQRDRIFVGRPRGRGFEC